MYMCGHPPDHWAVNGYKQMGTNIAFALASQMGTNKWVHILACLLASLA